ncbi:MAG: hypothetical protein AB7E95_06370 [Kiritimatiellales bacterium]
MRSGLKPILLMLASLFLTGSAAVGFACPADAHCGVSCMSAEHAASGCGCMIFETLISAGHVPVDEFVEEDESDNHFRLRNWRAFFVGYCRFSDPVLYPAPPWEAVRLMPPPVFLRI